jgi:hypothetical protein
MEEVYISETLVYIHMLRDYYYYYYYYYPEGPLIVFFRKSQKFPFSVSGLVPECQSKMAANDDQAGRQNRG